MKKKSYFFNFKGNEGDISYETHEGHVDSKKYSLLEVAADENLGYLKLSDRIDIINSWAYNHIMINKHPLQRMTLLGGCKPITTVIDPFSGQKKELINLASNDYLNLSHHPRVIKAAENALNNYGLGVGSSPFIVGTTDIHEELENKLASLSGSERAMLFTSTYVTNIGIMRALLRQDDLAIIDILAHGSLVDGASANVTNKIFFNHNDVHFLEKILKRSKDSHINRIVIVDGVYSMEGDVAPLDEIIPLAHHYDAWVLVDEAHSIGNIGKTGKGTLEYFGMEGQADVVVGSLSKTLGCVGGYVAGKEELIKYLYFTNRAYFLSTANTIPNVAGILEALKVMEEEPGLYENLNSNVSFLKKELSNLGFDTGNTITAIIPIIIGEEGKLMSMLKELLDQNIIMSTIIYPAVKKNSARLRLSLTTGHTREQLERVLDVLEKSGKKLGVI